MKYPWAIRLGKIRYDPVELRDTTIVNPTKIERYVEVVLDRNMKPVDPLYSAYHSGQLVTFRRKKFQITRMEFQTPTYVTLDNFPRARLEMMEVEDK